MRYGRRWIINTASHLARKLPYRSVDVGFVECNPRGGRFAEAHHASPAFWRPVLCNTELRLYRLKKKKQRHDSRDLSLTENSFSVCANLLMQPLSQCNRDRSGFQEDYNGMLSYCIPLYSCAFNLLDFCATIISIWQLRMHFVSLEFIHIHQVNSLTHTFKSEI